MIRKILIIKYLCLIISKWHRSRINFPKKGNVNEYSHRNADT